MKKLLTLVICLLMMGGIYAQEQHLTFKGVPIDGTLNSFKNAMIKEGFHYVRTNDGVVIMSGYFAGYNNCIILVSAANNKLVNEIGVFFPSKLTWSGLMQDYEYLKEMMNQKYGKSYDCKEVITEYYDEDDDYVDEEDSDDLIPLALREGEYEWYTKYETELGTIELTIGPGHSYNDGCVILIYSDKINCEKAINAAYDDL